MKLDKAVLQDCYVAGTEVKKYRNVRFVFLLLQN